MNYDLVIAKANHTFELLGLLFNLGILAVVLGVVGWGASKAFHAYANSRRNARMNAEALVAAAKSRAAKRQAARA